MTNEPWKKWIPGVLSQDQMKVLCQRGYIEGVDQDPILDASSLDLHLTDEAYRFLHGSVKPFGARYLNDVKSSGLAEPLRSEDGTYQLNPRETYLFKIRERLHGLQEGNFHGQATAKSSIGRLDVLARLIVDGMDCYEIFNPKGPAHINGDMYLEVTPITFPVRVRAGSSLSQLRIFYCEPQTAEIRGRELCQALIHKDGGTVEDESLSVDLSETDVGGDKGSAFGTKITRETLEPINLWETKETDKPDPRRYWQLLRCDTYGETKTNRLRIEKNDFYILRSKERLALPPRVAVYCRATDETIGEMRIHYAGFAHPYFGYERPDRIHGTPLIFEVRGHDVHVSLRDGEKMARLIFYRMSQDAREPDQPSPYETQTLKLSKFFAEWKPRKRES